MSLELHLTPRPWWRPAGLMGTWLLVLAALLAVGWRITPVAADGTPQLLTWSDWTLAQRQAQVLTEVQRLRSETETLAALLAAPPDAVRAGLTLERVQALTHTGAMELAPQRAALLAAAEAVQGWAAGVVDYAVAVEVVRAAIAALE